MASVGRLPSGKWRVRWRDGGGRGGPAQTLTFATEAEAVRFRGMVDAAGQRWPDAYRVAEPTGGRTVAEWAGTWLDTLPRVRERVRGEYRRMLARTLLAHLGHRPVAAVTPGEVRAWLRTLEHLAPKTQQNVAGLASSLFKAAVAEGLRTDNPCAGVRVAQVQRSDMVMLTVQEVDLLAGCGDELLRDVVLTLAYTGLRWGELTGLDCGHVDLLAPVPVVRVRQSWQRSGGIPSHILGPPKSPRAVRDVPVPGRLVDVLAPRAVGQEWEPVFRGARGSRLDNRGFHRGRWQPALVEARARGLGKRPRLHDLRHTYVSWLLASPGVTIYEVARMVGHESVTTTDRRYGHLTSTHAARVVAALDGLGGGTDRVGRPTSVGEVTRAREP